MKAEYFKIYSLWSIKQSAKIPNYCETNTLLTPVHFSSFLYSKQCLY